VFHLYILRVERRDELCRYLNDVGVEAKIHYPKPIHLQPAAKGLGYGKGSFPVTENDAEQIISLPLHQYLAGEEIEFVNEKVRDFYVS